MIFDDVVDRLNSDVSGFTIVDYPRVGYGKLVRNRELHPIDPGEEPTTIPYGTTPLRRRFGNLWRLRLMLAHHMVHNPEDKVLIATTEGTDWQEGDLYEELERQVQSRDLTWPSFEERQNVDDEDAKKVVDLTIETRFELGDDQVASNDELLKEQVLGLLRSLKGCMKAEVTGVVLSWEEGEEI